MGHFHFQVVMVLCALLFASVDADAINETFKLTSSDAAAADLFGAAAALSGNTAIIGAPRNDDAGFNSGSAYVFDTTTGNQLFKLTASDAAAVDQFGWSVAVSGTTAVVGALGDDDAGSSSGSAYIFDTTTGNELFKLTASDGEANDAFGAAAALSGNTAIIGAPRNDVTGFLDEGGAAYVFDLITGSELFKLTASDAAKGDFFGFSVALSGNTAVVGAPDDDDADLSSGAAYVFDTTTGNQLFKLTASDAAFSDQFGWSVAVSGTTAVIGARSDEIGGNRTGSAYVFDTTTGNQLFKLTASDGEVGDQFGVSVAVSGNIAIVGARHDDDVGGDSGSAYVFDTTTGNQLFKLTSSDAVFQDSFGFSVALSGNTAVVGALGDPSFGNVSGSAYVFNNVPEPATGLLLAVAALAALRRRHRARYTACS